MKNFFQNNFRRVTANGIYIPEIDGLRFLSIFFVLVCHASVHFFEFSGLKSYYNALQIILEQGHNGVRIFFSISGFILMHNALIKMNLRSYYRRRIFRIEPPYFIALIIIYFILFHRSLIAYLLNFFCSIFYIHSFVYNTPSIISPITWSLEVEVQFYLTFPLFFYCIQFFEKRIKLGVAFIVFIIIIGLIYNYFIIPQYRTLLDNLTFFYTGVLLAFLYKKHSMKSFYIKPEIVSVLLLIIITLLIVVNSVNKNIFFQFIYIALIFLLFHLVLYYNSFIRQFFKSYFISITGGMCYTIYLYHILLLLLFDKYLFNEVRNMPYFVFLYTLVYFLVLWFLSLILFSFFEKPFMKFK